MCLFLQKKIAEKEMGMSQGWAGFLRDEEIGSVIVRLRCNADIQHSIIIDFH